MVIGILHIDLFIPNSQSLKEKRVILKSLKTRLHNNFNVAVSELEHQEKWQRAAIGIVSISNGKKAMDTMFANIVKFVNRQNYVDMIEYSTEFL